MTKQNSYFVPNENIPAVAEVRYLDEEQNLLTKEQLEEQRRVEESYYEEFAGYGNLGVVRSYGPGSSPSK